MSPSSPETSLDAPADTKLSPASVSGSGTSDSIALAPADAPERVAAPDPSQPAVDNLDPRELQLTPQDVRGADYARLKAVLAQLKLGLDINARTLVQLRRVVRNRPREDRSQFDDAYAQVRVREVALRASILAASQASPESAAAAQAQVAADYEAYARAVTVADATARASREALANNTTDLR